MVDKVETFGEHLQLLAHVLGISFIPLAAYSAHLGNYNEATFILTAVVLLHLIAYQ